MAVTFLTALPVILIFDRLTGDFEADYYPSDEIRELPAAFLLGTLALIWGFPQDEVACA